MHRNTVTRSWGPFIRRHQLMFQHDNARICTQFLEAENVPVLPWPAYLPDMSPIDHVWDALDRGVRQHVPVPANIQQLRTPIEVWDNIPQTTINSPVNAMKMCLAAWGKWWSHQILTGFLIHASTFKKKYQWPTNAYLHSQSCEIHRLGPNECISIDWFPYLFFNSLKLLHFVFILLFSVYVHTHF